MNERPKGENLSDPTIGSEKEGLTQEKRFFESRLKGNYIGVLTNSQIGIVSLLYPEIVDGMLGLYYYLEKDSTDPLSEDGFLNKHIRNMYSTSTTLVSNDEIARMRDDLSSGKYSDQFAIVRKFKNMALTQAASSRGEKRFDAYKTVSDDTDLVFNKRVCLQRINGLRNDLQEVYGEVNYGQALVTELLISAPFTDTIIRGEGLQEDETRQRHTAYIDEAAEFARGLDLDARLQKFLELTKQYSASWTFERTPYQLPGYDKEYLQRAYKLAGEIIDDSRSIDDVHSLLSETLLRRGKVFSASLIKSTYGETRLLITPEQPFDTIFDDIAGYKDQKEFLQALLAKTAKKDALVDDIRIVISAGKPGLGKSLGVKAFLNSLPDNAKGVLISTHTINRNEEVTEYKHLHELAKLHPDLHIFAVIEDIDALAGNRLQSAATAVFLQIDSVGSESNPKNLHLIATTNRPDVIDAAVTRPGRTAKILVYEPPQSDERRKVAEYHIEKNNYVFPNELLDKLTKRTDGFTPDEIRYIIWSLRFADIESPSSDDIEKYAKDVETRRKIELEASGKKMGLGN